MFRRFIFLLLMASTLGAWRLPGLLAQDQQRPRAIIPANPKVSTLPVAPQGAPLRSRSLPALNLAPATLADLKSRIEEIAHQPALEPGFLDRKSTCLNSSH